MIIPDVRRMSAAQRRHAAEAIRVPAMADPERFDFALPRLDFFNYSPCRAHLAVDPACTDCGVEPRGYQRAGAAWLFASGHGLLADDMGTGKTIQCAMLFAMCLATGELSEHDRAVVACKAVAVPQWAAQLRRLLPSARVVTSAGAPVDRARAYLSPWDVAVVSDRVLVPQSGSKKTAEGDVELLCQLPVSTLVYDDLDACRHEGTQTHWAVQRLAARCKRVHGAHGTPLQKEIEELYTFLEPVGALRAFGTRSRFRNAYVKHEPVRFWVTKPDASDPTGRSRQEETRWKGSGVRQEALPDFKARLAPLVLRRTAESLGGQLPDVVPCRTWVDLLPAQRSRYAELRKGVLRRITEAGENVTAIEAMQAYLRGAQICSGLAALDDGSHADVSVKLDWVTDKVTTELGEEKAVCFVYFRPNVAALSRRLTRLGVGHVVIWSEENDPRVRAERQRRFTEDPSCRVLIGTTAIEQSLNLQRARHLIAVDTIPNPARMAQLIGRVRRLGSSHSSVFFHHLLARGTQERRYPEALAREAGMAAAVWGESEDVFTAMTPLELMQMVAAE